MGDTVSSSEWCNIMDTARCIRAAPVVCHAVYAGVWLRANETEISAVVWTLRLGVDFTDVMLVK